VHWPFGQTWQSAGAGSGISDELSGVPKVSVGVDEILTVSWNWHLPGSGLAPLMTLFTHD